MLMAKAETTKKVAKTKTTPSRRSQPAKVKSVTKATVVPAEVPVVAVRRTRQWLIPVAVVLIALVGLGVWKYLDQQKQLTDLKNAQTSAKEANEQLIEDVGKVAVIPPDEQPVVREVEELESLAKQPFYAEAEIGDKVLLFTKAKRAFLYRPSTKQIVNISSNIIIQGTEAAGSETTPAP